MFRALLEPIIRSMTTVYAAPGTSYTPDDVCKERPKHVERSISEIKITTQLHRVGLFNNVEGCNKCIKIKNMCIKLVKKTIITGRTLKNLRYTYGLEFKYRLLIAVIVTGYCIQFTERVITIFVLLAKVKHNKIKIIKG